MYIHVHMLPGKAASTLGAMSLLFLVLLYFIAN